MPIDLFGGLSTAILVLSLIYFFVEAVLVYDMRLIQARTGRFISPVATAAEGLSLPSWIRYLHVAGWLLLISIAVLNWRFAIALYLLLYALRVLPVLERVGEQLMRPFLFADHDAALREVQEKLVENQENLSRARQEWEETIHLLGSGSTLADFVPDFQTWWLRRENQERSLGEALERYVDEYDLYDRTNANEPHDIRLARSILKVLDTATLAFEGEDAVRLHQYISGLTMRVRAYDVRTSLDHEYRHGLDTPSQ